MKNSTRNWVAKHAHKYNRAQTFKDRTKYDRKSYDDEIYSECTEYYRERAVFDDKTSRDSDEN